jgi:hypothetical protein
MTRLSDDWRIDYDDLEIVEPLARGNFAEVHRFDPRRARQLSSVTVGQS